MNTIAIAPIDAIGHAHVADLDACLDFINSESYDDGVPQEHLPTADDAVAYFTLRGLAHEDALRVQAARDNDAWLARIHGLRAALREIWDAEVEHRIPDQHALDVVNAVLREAPRIELIAREDCCGVAHRHSGHDPTGEALARVVGPLVEAIAAGQTGRFRICANDGCREALVDTSRGGRRRWCDMSSCGNVAKVRRYRDRRKGADAPADQPPAGA